jgi:dinuclear metal center YbgI/SA1388 family protein
MKLEKIYNILNKISPFEIQEKWDNSGVNIGSFTDEIQDIVLSLDIDTTLVEQLKPNTLLITHHPLIFSPLKKIDDIFPSNIIKKMIKKDISLISMHTNFDKTHLNTYVLEQVLGFVSIKKDGFLEYCDVDMTFENLQKYITKKLNLKYIKNTPSDKKQIKRLAFCTGSGASLIKEVKADCFLTGDIKYHDGMLARELGIALIDIGHFESEIFFGDILHTLLQEQNINSTIKNSTLAFSYKNI